MYCENCGRKIIGEAKFCPYCGALVKAEKSQSPATTSQKQAVENKSTYILLTTIGVACLAIAFFCTFFILRKSNKTKTTENLEEIEQTQTLSAANTNEDDIYTSKEDESSDNVKPDKAADENVLMDVRTDVKKKYTQIIYLEDGTEHIEYQIEYDKNENIIKTLESMNENLKKNTTTYQYDSKGYLISEKHFGDDNSLEYYDLYDTDSDGNIIGRQRYLPNGEMDDAIKFVYGDKGKTKEELWYRNGELSSHTEEKFDDAGNSIGRYTYNTDGTLAGYSLSEYDGNRLLITRGYDKNGALSNYYECKYDANGYMEESTQYNADGSILYQFIMENDSHGNTISSEYKNYSNSEYNTYTTYENEYDNLDNLIKQEMIEKGKSSGRIVYEYYTVDELLFSNDLHNDENLPESELRNIADEYGKVAAWHYADYDGDGTKEAYALIVAENEYGDEEIDKVCFVNSQGEVSTMESAMGGYYYESQDGCYREYMGNGFFWADLGAGGSGWWTLLYGVKDGRPYALDLSEKIQGFYEEGGVFYTTEDEFSDTEGHLYLEIELIYDKNTKQFKKGDSLNKYLY